MERPQPRIARRSDWLRQCGGTIRDQYGLRWLMPLGVKYVTAELINLEAAKKRWSKHYILTIVGIVLGVLIATIVVSLMIPAVRRWLHLN